MTDQNWIDSLKVGDVVEIGGGMPMSYDTEVKRLTKTQVITSWACFVQKNVGIEILGL